MELSTEEIWETWNPARLNLTPGPFAGLWELWVPSKPMPSLLLREVVEGNYSVMGYIDEDTVFVNLEEEL